MVDPISALSGAPSFSGGDAGPSGAFGDAGRGQSITFANPFNISSGGGVAESYASALSGQSPTTNYLLIGAVVLGVFFFKE